ncbi:MAG: type II toxin-antitoxin system death-on-curing family toxin [Archangium sp.]|nr:type II toxin-antitoxin system death-on-curing family toxin [Archangium sp.]
MKLEFLELDEVLAIHAESIRRFGGATGLRDPGLLESALAMPRATMFGELLHSTIHEQAAAYLFHLVKNHPFVDGNKRVGLGVALTFLGMNSIWVEASSDELVELVLGVVEGRVSKSEAAVFFEKHAEPWR